MQVGAAVRQGLYQCIQTQIDVILRDGAIRLLFSCLISIH
jgi:hypothetical protein